jgi:hypothetical protein
LNGEPALVLPGGEECGGIRAGEELVQQRYYVYGTFFDVASFPYLSLTDPHTFVPGMPFVAYAGARATF